MDDNLIRIWGLDKDGNLVKKIQYVSLLWNRMYHEAGTYQLEIKPDEFDKDIAMIYSPDRPEVGMVEKIDAIDQAEGKHMLIWGSFMEKKLDRDVIYPVANVSGGVVRCAYSLFDNYSKQGFYKKSTGEIGENIIMQATGDELGTKLYDMLLDQGYTYNVSFSFYTKVFTFEIWKGVDTSEAQTENNAVVFTKSLGNLTSSTHTYDESIYKNYAYVAGAGEGAERIIEIVDIRTDPNEPKREVWIDARDLQQEEGMSDTAYRQVLQQRGREKMFDMQIINDFELVIDPAKEGRKYLVDFDIGNICTAILESGIKDNVRIIGVDEVVKENHLTVTLKLGKQIGRR